MLTVNDYKLQYSQVNFNTVLADKPDVFITEAAPVAGAPQLTDAEVAQLTQAGTKVFGYVDSSVTDDGRPYWNAAWTTDRTDKGELTDAAPDWLKINITNSFGYYADIKNVVWKQIVIDQCVDLVRRGYSGIFLDDVSQYFNIGAALGDSAGWARAMLDLVTDVKDAITAVNPKAELIINSTPYITSDAVGAPTSDALITEFNSKVDAMMLEVFFGISFGEEAAGIQQAIAEVLPYMTVITLEYGGTPYQRYLFQQQSKELGFVPGISVDETYSSYGATVADATDGIDDLLGTRRADKMFGKAGNDTLRGSDGNDQLYGNTGNDMFYGGTGKDILSGGVGADTMYGGADSVSDTFQFVIGASGQTWSTFDTITGFQKGALGVGDQIDFGSALKVGGSSATASTNQASINSATGIATFTTGSGTTLYDALNDIANRFTAAGDSLGEFALFKLSPSGPVFMYFSDGQAGVTTSDVVIRLQNIFNVNAINLTDGDLTILS